MEVNNIEMYKEYKDKVMAWIEEQAKNPAVTQIDVKIPSNEMGVYPSDTNGWDCDWWGEDTVEFGGRKWDVSGGAWYGDVCLSIPEDDDDDRQNCDSCIDRKDCEYLADGEHCED